MYKFVKIQWNNGSKQWYFMPQDLTDISVHATNTLTLEMHSAIREHQLLHLYGDSYAHCVTPMGIGVNVKTLGKLMPPTSWEDQLIDLVRTTIQDRMSAVEKDYRVFLANGHSWMALPRDEKNDSFKIVDTKEFATYGFPTPRKLYGAFLEPFEEQNNQGEVLYKGIIHDGDDKIKVTDKRTGKSVFEYKAHLWYACNNLISKLNMERAESVGLSAL